MKKFIILAVAVVVSGCGDTSLGLQAEQNVGKSYELPTAMKSVGMFR